MVYDGRSVLDGCQMVYDGPSVSDGCQMVYDSVGWLYREGLSDGEDGADGVWWSKCVRWLSDSCQMVYDGRRVSFGVGCLYYVSIFYYYLHIPWPTMYIKI